MPVETLKLMDQPTFSDLTRKIRSWKRGLGDEAAMSSLDVARWRCPRLRGRRVFPHGAGTESAWVQTESIGEPAAHSPG